MNQLEIFEHPEFREIRAMEIDGEPWLVGKDVAQALGYNNTRDALTKHVDEEDKGVAKCDTLGGAQELTVINESGLYSLIFSSQLPDAKKFKRWVTRVVLPSIRKNGGYIAGQERLTMTREELQAAALAAVRKVMEEQQTRSSAVAAPPEESRFLKYFNSFMRWRENHSPTDKIVALYIGFLDVFNRRGWEEWTNVNTPLLMMLSNAARKETAYSTRDALVEAGFLEYKPGKKGKPSSYRLLVYDAPALHCGAVK